jgi:hypothetical protein
VPLTEISAGGVSRRDFAAFAGRDGTRPVGLVRLPVRAGDLLRLRARSSTLRTPSTRRVVDGCDLDDHLVHHAIDAARMTRGIGTLAGDSTSVPPGYGATGRARRRNG